MGLPELATLSPNSESLASVLIPKISLCILNASKLKALLSWLFVLKYILLKISFHFSEILNSELHCLILIFFTWGFGLLSLIPLFVTMHCIFSHINRRTQFENPVLEAKRRLEQQRQMQSQGLSALPLPTIYRGTHEILQHVRYLNQNMLTYSQSQKYENARSAERTCMARNIGLYAIKGPWNSCADRFFDYSPWCTDFFYQILSIFSSVFLICLTEEAVLWVFDGADAQCHSVRGRIEISGSAVDREHARPEAPSGFIQTRVWWCTRPVHNVLPHLSENSVSPMSQLIRIVSSFVLLWGKKKVRWVHSGLKKSRWTLIWGKMWQMKEAAFLIIRKI